MRDIKNEYDSQTDALMGSYLSAMTFTLAAFIREKYNGAHNILVAIPTIYILMSIFRFIAATTKVIMKKGVDDAYYSSLRPETEQSAASAVNQQIHHLLGAARTMKPDYNIPHLIDILFNPIDILVDLCTFLSRMFAQLIAMLLMSYISGMEMWEMVATFFFLRIAQQAYLASNAPPTPPPSPVVNRKRL